MKHQPMSASQGAMLSRLLAGILVLFGVVILLVAVQSYNGRVQVIQTQRRACLGFGRSVMVPLANVIRASEIGNRIIASDPKQPLKTRLARARQADLESLGLLQFDHRIDPRVIGKLNPTGRSVILGWVRRGQAFSCKRAYPDASLTSFFGTR